MSQTIQSLKGFRDFLPTEKRARDVIKKKIEKVFVLYGFEPLETPTLEYASLLLGKYGDEADKLVYTFEDKGNRQIGLRYDQTVPTARVLNQYQSVLPRYFRRFQIQNVFRADKPQQGRYREFTQADADVFNAPEPFADAEILAVFYAIFAELKLNQVKILVNDRRALVQAVTPFATNSLTTSAILTSIDKLDKLSIAKVQAELISKGLDSSSAENIISILQNIQAPTSLTTIIDSAVALGIPEKNLVYSPTLARGLDYYTGLIFEAVLPDTKGSLGAGGRYDQLIHDLGGPSTPAVGFGLGFDRIVEAVDRNTPLTQSYPYQVLVTLFDPVSAQLSLQVAHTLRQANISTHLYPALDKLQKQLELANTQRIPYVVIIGPNEVKDKVVTLKHMQSGEQQTIPIDQLTIFFEN
jgi:histidyl-tRNA synthetase